MTDIIFIGGGPIGLLAAIQLKLTCPQKEILLFEKYEEPIRNHAMYVDHRSFARMNRNEGFGELLDSLSSKIIISELEKKLRAYALSINITIQYREIKDFDALKTEYPDTQYFVGSGGLRGIIHPQIFNSENQINDALRYAVEVKYKASGATKSLSKMYQVLSQRNHLVSEYVGHLKDEVTPISLRIFIDEPTYQEMKNATFKNPYSLADTGKIPKDLLDSMVHYLNLRENLAQEVRIEDSLKISTITLSVYASMDFCKRVDGKAIFKIGEEAFACPFYRSFNDNASCIPYFTKSMQALFEQRTVESKASSYSSFYAPSSSIEEKEPLKYYQQRIQRFVNSEIPTIYLLNSGIDMIESSAASSRYVSSSSRRTDENTTGSSCTLS
jgi:hypothetical protein